MKQQARATLRITPPSEDEHGKIWIPRAALDLEGRNCTILVLTDKHLWFVYGVMRLVLVNQGYGTDCLDKENNVENSIKLKKQTNKQASITFSKIFIDNLYNVVLVEIKLYIIHNTKYVCDYRS